jgi:hypothetical protein
MSEEERGQRDGVLLFSVGFQARGVSEGGERYVSVSHASGRSLYRPLQRRFAKELTGKRKEEYASQYATPVGLCVWTERLESYITKS